MKLTVSDASEADAASMVDWRHASMEDALLALALALAKALAKRYPWLTVKARAGVVGACTLTWK